MHTTFTNTKKGHTELASLLMMSNRKERRKKNNSQPSHKRVATKGTEK